MTIEEARQKLWNKSYQDPNDALEVCQIINDISQPKPKTDVLDKLRAEIDNALSDGMIHKKTVLVIIDKYKAEIELKESEK